MRTYSATEAARAARITYRQLDYVTRTGFVVPSVPAAGSGSRRRYSVPDVARIRLAYKLVRAGVSWDQLRADNNPRLTARRVYRELAGLQEPAA